MKVGCYLLIQTAVTSSHCINGACHVIKRWFHKSFKLLESSTLRNIKRNVFQIELSLGSDPSVAVGWRKKDQKVAAAGQISIGTSAIGVVARYTRRFSTNSHGRITGKIGKWCT
uniref:Uncharacterized protein n=1 Tax=Lactuca sativa TaxID=4236 RepID=A0A9R1VBE6_LACSA|nr:hypothetical protein LSAT_V11C500236920 [Lactuca sativa]